MMEEQRYPISVRVIGVLHKEKSKMYMTSVLWSDQNDIVVYRTFQDFKKMHKQLKKAFPPASKLKKSDRVIPKFRGTCAQIPVFTRISDAQLWILTPDRPSVLIDRKITRQKKTPTKSLLRLKFLQKYCNELLSCSPRVSQSADLIKFFHPKDQDLQPEFARNGIMIMPSEDQIMADSGQANGGNVTQPFVTETYRCVAPYETKDTNNKPFKVAVDEKVDVLIKDKAGWWLVENESKKMAWFPAPYLEKIDDFDDEDDVDGIPEGGMMYTVVKTYKATKNDEISVNIGTVVEVLQKSDNGWWIIRHGSKVGYIPTMYLQPYNYPHIRMTTTHNQDSGPTSPNLEKQSLQFSHSQGNLLLLPSARAPSPNPLAEISRQKSRSFNTLSVQPPAPPALPAARSTAPLATSNGTTRATPYQAPPPRIMVGMDGDEEEQRGRSLTVDSEESLMSDSTDFSFSDDLSSSSESSTPNLSLRVNDDRMRLSRTPPPMVNNRRSSTTIPEGKMIPSISDPNLYKGPKTPTVPPRPRKQEILTRCSTITRKKASKVALLPPQTAILSQ
ncbi:NADPH oxidase organizer 1 [Collichthys lucidus]|uniref:NADPH oxidase organizer 1 n=1 Tax=Collichthys lucidus TaxID=240159 RepID=A0A4V6ATE0_COLLU|nr:NADPH oxidase organizer 1 [Collichthys lucidus]